MSWSQIKFCFCPVTLIGFRWLCHCTHKGFWGVLCIRNCPRLLRTCTGKYLLQIKFFFNFKVQIFPSSPPPPPKKRCETNQKNVAAYLKIRELPWHYIESVSTKLSWNCKKCLNISSNGKVELMLFKEVFLVYKGLTEC